MPVIGLSIDAVDAKKESDVVPDFKIRSGTNLLGVDTIEVPGIPNKVLAVKFEFLTEYLDGSDKKFANISMVGRVMHMSPETDNLMKMWKEKKELTDDVNLEVINSVLRRCTTKALVLSEDLQLPPPIVLPYASSVKK